MMYNCAIGEHRYDVTVGADGLFTIGSEKIAVHSTMLSEKEMSLLVNGKSYRVAFCRNGSVVNLIVDGQLMEVIVESERDALLKRYGGSSSTKGSKEKVFAPMPALVVKVEVNVGDLITAGQGLIILEAMKMENEIKSPQAGKVKSILVKKGNTVEKGTLLLELESA